MRQKNPSGVPVHSAYLVMSAGARILEMELRERKYANCACVNNKFTQNIIFKLDNFRYLANFMSDIFNIGVLYLLILCFPTKNAFLQICTI